MRITTDDIQVQVIESVFSRGEGICQSCGETVRWAWCRDEVPSHTLTECLRTLHDKVRRLEPLESDD